jgi:hypothetical protein
VPAWRAAIVAAAQLAGTALQWGWGVKIAAVVRAPVWWRGGVAVWRALWCLSGRVVVW